MSGEVRNVKVRLSVENAQAIAGVKQFGAATEATATQVQRAGVNHAKAWASIGRGARNVAIGGAIALGLIEKASYSFDKQMSSVDAATHETARNMGLLREAAVKAGADTAFSATEAAAGITELAKAGVTTKAVLGGGLKGALDLAAAGQISVAEAAETAASAMTQFELKGKNVPHIADLLAAGAGKAQGSVHDLGMALNQSGLVASQTGLTIEDTTGTLAAFAKAGLIGSDAGTSFKTMLMSLNPRSAEAADLMKRYNIEAYDAQGNFVGITKYAGKLREGLKGLTSQQRAAALQTIFGTDAIRAANILYRQGAPGIRKWIDNVNDQGYAADTAARQMDNLAGDVEKLGGTLQSAFIGAGGGAQKQLREMVQGVDGLVKKFTELPEGVQQGAVKAVAALTGIAGAVYGVTKAVKGYQAIKAIAGSLSGGKAATGAAGGMPGIGVQKVFVTNPGFGTASSATTAAATRTPAVVATKGKLGAANVISGLAIAAATIYSAKTIWNSAEPLRDATISADKALDSGNTQQQEAALKKLTEERKKALTLDNPYELGKKTLNDVLSLDLKNLGGLRMAKGLFGVLSAQFGDSKAKSDELKASLDQTTEGVNRQERATANASGAWKAATTALSAQDYALASAKSGLSNFSELLDQLPAGVQTKILTPGAVESTEDVKRLARRYDLTPRQIETMIRLLGGPEAIAETDRVEARLNRLQGKTINTYIKTLATSPDPKAPKSPTKQTAQNLPQLLAPAAPRIDIAGYAKQLKNIPAKVMTQISAPGAQLSRTQALELGRQYKLTPKQVQTLMKAAGVPKAHTDIGGVRGDMARLNRQKANPKVSVDTGSAFAGIGRIRSALNAIPDEEVKVRVTRGQAGAGATAGGSLTPADGATVPGSRFPYRDSVHAIVAPTEEIISNRYGQADRHRPLLKAINANRFADGGTVGAISGSSSGASSVTVIFPAPAVVKAAVDAANQIAISAASTARSAADTRTAHLEDLHAQQRIRDLTAELAKTEKVTVKGKDGKDDNKKKKGVQDTLKTITQLAVRGLDRTVAQAELADAKLALVEAKAQLRLDAIAALNEKAGATAATLAGDQTIFAGAASPMAAIRSTDKRIADISAYGQMMARLKGAGASPALLAQVMAQAEGGDYRSANRLGNALLAQPAALGQLNASLSTLGAVSSNVATMTTDPRFMGTGAWNPTGQVSKVVQLEINLNADPSTWTADITRHVTHNVLAAMVGD